MPPRFVILARSAGIHAAVFATGDPLEDGRAFPATERRWHGVGMGPRPAAEDDGAEGFRVG